MGTYEKYGKVKAWKLTDINKVSITLEGDCMMVSANTDKAYGGFWFRSNQIERSGMWKHMSTSLA